MDLKKIIPHLKDDDIFRNEEEYFSKNAIKRFFQRLLDRKILGQIELLIAKARSFGLPEKDIKEGLTNLEYHEPEVAFIVIVEQMYEFEIKTDQDFFNLAMEICETLNLDKTNYQFLKELIQL